MLKALYPDIKMYLLVFFLVLFKKHKKVMTTINAVLTIGIGLLLIKTIPCAVVKNQISLCCVKWFSFSYQISFLVFLYIVSLDFITLVIFKLPNDFNALSVISGIAQILLLAGLVYSTLDLISKGKYTVQNYQVEMTAFMIVALYLCVFGILLYQGICKRTLKIGLGSKSNKSIPLFYEMAFRTELIAFTAWFTILANNTSRDFIGGILTFISTFATFLYPMLDMYKFTRTKLDEYEKEKNFEAVRKKQEEAVRKREEEIENESNGSKNYTA